jgi:XTP/dITP diphosphohydrolase
LSKDSDHHLFPPNIAFIRMTTLVIATRNAHKVQEIRAILAESFQYLTLNDFPGAPAVTEDAETFAANAAKKAMELAHWLGSNPSFESRFSGSTSFVLADDSGLEVDALNGAPGVHSARFAALDDEPAGAGGLNAAGNSSDAANNAKLLRLLSEVPLVQRTARFRCVMGLVEIQPQSSSREPRLFEGTCEGRIQFAPRGAKGFGYDPLFVPIGYEQSFAELGEEVKNRLSHRAQALAKLREWFQKKLP